MEGLLLQKSPPKREDYRPVGGGHHILSQTFKSYIFITPGVFVRSKGLNLISIIDSFPQK